MEHAWGLPLLLFYLSILTYFVYKWKHFNDESISKKLIYLFFFYKLFLGFCLTWIYIYYYKVHSEADIFKYYDDSKEMTRALWENPVDFFKIFFCVGNDN